LMYPTAALSKTPGSEAVVSQKPRHRQDAVRLSVAHNSLAVLNRVIASPAPEVLEEERQCKELETSIALRAHRKPPVVGIAGAGNGRKSKGTGFIYEERIFAPHHFVNPLIEYSRTGA